MTDTIITLIIVALGFIFTAARAGKKKATRSTSGHQSQIPAPAHRDPWEDIIRKAQNNDEFELEATQMDEAEEIEKINQKRLEDVNMRSKKTNKSKYISESQETETIASSSSKESHNQTEGFNVRDAVIYSEILKPKF